MTASAYFRLSERLQRGIASVLKWSSLRPVQEATIDAVRGGNNALVLAPTAGGKTEAAFFPILDALHAQPTEGVGCVYVSPLRALLNNQEGRIDRLAGLVGLDAFKWHGDVPGGPRKRFLEQPADVLLTTPESLEVILMTGRASEHRLFEHLRFVVIDEIHALAADDRGAHLLAVVERLARLTNRDVQRVGLSATVGNPEGLARWMQGTSDRPWTVVDPPRERIPRRVAARHVGKGVEETAAEAVPLARGRKSIFFTQGRADTERIRQSFARLGVPAFVHHSSVSRELREEAEARFMGTEGPATLISTSTLELGIDVGDLDLVLQLDSPFTVSSFLQRMGRTGRRPGTHQHLEFFTSKEEPLLRAAALVNLARAGFVEVVEPSRANTPVFLHQILAQVVERSGVGRAALWRVLRGPSPFADIDRGAFDRIVEHLVQTDVLSEVDRVLTLGEAGERAFGGRNFFDLYSVFEASSEVTVKTPDGRVVGTLEMGYVWQMQGKEFAFLLAGTEWRATEVDLDRALVIAVPIAGGKAPQWGGGGGILGREVAEEMRRLLLVDEALPFVDEAGRSHLEGMRTQWRPLLGADRCPLVRNGDTLRIYTFAGGRINATLAALLESEGVASVGSFGGFGVDLKGPTGGRPDVETVRAALRRGRQADTRFSAAEKAGLVSEKVRGKLAKFQPYLPPDLEGAYLADRLFDLPGVARLAQDSEFLLL